MAVDRLKMILELQEKDPNDPFLAYAAALEYQKKGEHDEAIQRLQKLMSDDPEYLGTYYQLGKMLEQKGKMDAAVVAYKAGMKVAKTQKDSKTLGELTEALFILVDDE